MQIRNADMHPMRKIVNRQHHMPKGGFWGRDQGNVTLTLECGHKLERKHSQTKHKLCMRCKECDYKASPPVQERGPFRHRDWIDPRDRRLQRRRSRVPDQGLEDSLDRSD
jgi:hypothetical protein